MPTYKVDDESLKATIEKDLKSRLPRDIQPEIQIVPFLDSNVEVKFEMGRYVCTFCIVIGLMPDQYKPTIAFTVKWIKDHYENNKASPKYHFAPLKPDERFLFIFTPPNAVLSERTVEEMAGVLVPNSEFSDLRWIARAISHAEEAEQKEEMQRLLKSWLARQPSRDRVRFDMKVFTVKGVQTAEGEQDFDLTCLVAYLD